MPIAKLDAMDRRILEQIQADGSISNLEQPNVLAYLPPLVHAE